MSNDVEGPIIQSPTLSELTNRLITLEEEMRVLQKQFSIIEDRLTANTDTTTQIKEDTVEIISLFHTMTTALDYGKRATLTFGRLIQWLAAVVGAIGIIYVAWNNIRFTLRPPP